ncbi:MAG: oligosaccharide flippase family protein [Clostridia bacterium]|nr:oligosaccharide flippase family protein [Clostridia bacterium]
MKQKSFTYNTLFMTSANIITRFTGFLYRIFLSRFIGAEGLGLFALVSPVYSVCCAIVASGLPVAAMKGISEHLAKKDREGAKSFTFASLISVLIISFFLFIILFFSSPLLTALLGDERALPSLRILAFAVLITGFENIYKSAFYADGIVKVPAFTEIAEQLFRIVTVIFLIIYFAKDNITLSSAVLTFGIFAGEGLSLIILFFSYRRITGGTKVQSVRKHFSPLLDTAVPVTASKTAETFLASASNVLIPAMLTMYGFSRNEATEILGVISGMVMPLLFLPSVFTNAVSVNLVPFISANLAAGNMSALRRKVYKVLTVTALFSFPAFIFLSSFSKAIAEHIFSDSRVALFLPFMSFGAILATFRHILTSILNAASMAKKASFYSFAGNALQLLLTVILIPFFGISGYIASYILSNIFLLIPTAISVFSVIPCDKHLPGKLLLPALPAVSSFYTASHIYTALSHSLHPLIAVGCSAFSGLFLYLLIMFFCLKNKKIIFFSKRLD